MTTPVLLSALCRTSLNRCVSVSASLRVYLCAGLFALLVPIHAAQYTVTSVGVLPGDHSSTARSINNNGQVVGWSSSSTSGPHTGTQRAFVWQSGTLTPLPLLSGLVQSGAQGINSGGDIVGYCTNSDGHVYATLWSGGVATSLGTLADAPQDRSSGFAINDSKCVVGVSLKSNGLTAGVYWNGGPPIQMVPRMDSAGGINNTGTIVGKFLNNNYSQYHACVYKNGVFTDLGSLNTSSASDVNDAGKIVGLSYFSSTDSYNWHAAMWVNGVPKDLGNLGRRSEALAINELDEIVGHYNAPVTSEYRAFLWKNDQMIDLNTLIPADSGWTLNFAYDINDLGRIVGLGINAAGQSEAFLLTPVPEPATLSLLALGGLALLRRKRV